MAMARLVLRTCLLAEGAADLAAACRKARQRIGEESREGLSLTAFVGVLDTHTGELAYVNANPALLLHEGSPVSLPVSAEEIHHQSIRLSRGDLLCFYTAHSVAEGQGLPEHLQEKLPAAATPAELTAIMTDLLKAAGQEGDITVLALRWEGKFQAYLTS